eukprot:1192156-Prorocentrum_minimum.AAC.4
MVDVNDIRFVLSKLFDTRDMTFTEVLLTLCNVVSPEYEVSLVCTKHANASWRMGTLLPLPADAVYRRASQGSLALVLKCDQLTVTVMLVQVKLILLIEDPRAKMRRESMGVEDESGVSRDDICECLQQVRGSGGGL